MNPSSPASAPELLVERRPGGVAWITVNRPHKHNPLARSVLAALKDAVVEAGADEPTRCIVLTGAGERYFAAGGDLVDLMDVRTPDDVAAMVQQARGALDAIRDCPVPVVAYLNGDAIGGGAELAVACDMRMLSAKARIGFVQARLAITPAWGGGVDLCQLVGPSRALRMMARGEMIGAEQALAWGLADAVIHGQKDVDAFLGPLLERPPHVLRGVKAHARAWRRGEAYDERRALEQQHFTATWLHDDHWQAADKILSKEKQ
jgi:enoyl-CoA hydratase/carnithine racemase